MNFLKKHKLVILALMSLGLMANTCRMQINDITIPDSIPANDEIEFTVTGEYEPGAKGNFNVVFAILAPSSLNLKENAELLFSTTGFENFTGTNVSETKMELIPDSELEISKNLPYPAAYLSVVGVMGNIGGPVEWTVFRTKEKFYINDKADDGGGDNKYVTGTVKIKMKTGSENSRFYMGFSFCGTEKGLTEKYSDTEEYGYIHHEKAKLVEINGGIGVVRDYTVLQLISTVPSVFRYGDIFSINYEAEGSALQGVDKVYLCGKAVLADGTEKVMEEKVDKALMEVVSETSFSRYIYPRDFFSLPSDAEISKIYVWFSNADGSVVVKDGDNGHLLEQAAE